MMGARPAMLILLGLVLMSQEVNSRAGRGHNMGSQFYYALIWTSTFILCFVYLNWHVEILLIAPDQLRYRLTPTHSTGRQCF